MYTTIVAEAIYFLEMILSALSFHLLLDVRGSKSTNAFRGRSLLILIVYICGYDLFQRTLQKVLVYYMGEVGFSGLVNIILSFFSSYIFYTGKLKRRFMSYCTYFGAAIFAEIINIPLITYLLRENSIYGITSITDLYKDKTIQTMCIVIEAQIIVALWVALMFIVKIYVDNVWPRIYMWFVLLPVYEVYIFVMFYHNISKLDESTLVEGFVFFVLGFILDCLITGLILKIARDREISAKLENLERERQSELVYRELVNQSLEQIRMIRHDFKNQLQVVYAGLKADMSNEEAGEILDEMAHKIDASSTKRYCENNIINIILGLKEKEAQKAGIEYRVQCAVPNDIGIGSVDLCTIYNNAIDNAIEAVEMLGDEERYIEINSGIVNGFLTLKVVNPCKEDIDVSKAFIPSTKKDKKNHGMGLRRIKQVAEEHGGMVKLDCRDRKFEIIIGLKVSQDDTSSDC